MKTISEHVKAPRPKTLYHYTNQKGFLGIIKEKKIWATGAAYLNDGKEYIYAMATAKRVVSNWQPWPAPSITEP